MWLFANWVAIIAETIQDTIIVPTNALLNADDGSAKVMILMPDKHSQGSPIQTKFFATDPALLKNKCS